MTYAQAMQEAKAEYDAWAARELPSRVHRRYRPTRRATCPHGHSYTTTNTYVDKHGHRACWTCRRESWRRSNAKRAVFKDTSVEAA